MHFILLFFLALVGEHAIDASCRRNGGCGRRAVGNVECVSVGNCRNANTRVYSRDCSSSSSDCSTSDCNSGSCNSGDTSSSSSSSRDSYSCSEDGSCSRTASYYQVVRDRNRVPLRNDPSYQQYGSNYAAADYTANCRGSAEGCSNQRRLRGYGRNDASYGYSDSGFTPVYYASSGSRRRRY
jgi:hypothetical protein